MSYLEQRRQLKLTGKPAPVKKVYRIPTRSKTKIKFHKVYNPFVAEYLSRPENEFCAIKWENCETYATCINHKKRRFKDTVMNEKFIEPSCSWCNSEIENQHERAEAEGHLLCKFTPN